MYDKYDKDNYHVYQDIKHYHNGLNINDKQFQEALFAEMKLKGNDKLLCVCMYRHGES